MGWPFGEIKLAKLLDGLRVDLENYFGAVNMKKMNLPVPNMPDKPGELILQEQIEAYGVLPFPGGLMAQPSILMRSLRIVQDIRTIFSRMAKPKPQGQ